MMETEPHPVLNPEQEAELRHLKAHFPYRICWGELNPQTNEFACYASFDRRKLNKSLRSGNKIVIAGN